MSQVINPQTGTWIDSNTQQGRAVLKPLRTQIANTAKTKLDAQTNLAAAEVDADAQEYEAGQNREQGNMAFQYALSQAGNRRQPGGGIARGGAGRKGMSLNASTGGLAAANARARRSTQGRLASARVAAKPENMALSQIIKNNTGKLS
jgi:hypothetical protein